jgi:hypothetical protein
MDICNVAYQRSYLPQYFLDVPSLYFPSVPGNAILLDITRASVASQDLFATLVRALPHGQESYSSGMEMERHMIRWRKFQIFKIITGKVCRDASSIASEPIRCDQFRRSAYFFQNVGVFFSKRFE